MSLLTKIVKSAAVVDDRVLPRSVPQTGGTIIVGAPVLKQQVLQGMQGMSPGGTPRQVEHTVEGYQDELNRVRVEIARATAELRTIRRELDETRAETKKARSLLAAVSEDADLRNNELEEIQQKALQEAEHILQQAQEDSEAIREESRSQGYLEGFAQGTDEAREEFQRENQSSVQMLQELLETAGSFHRQQVEENEANLVNLVMAVAGKVLHRQLDENPEVLTDMLFDVVEKNRREDYIKITLAPDLGGVYAKTSQELLERLSRFNANISVYTDGNLDDGGCVVETPRGITDVGIHTQLNNIAATLQQL